jgi:hypothetical protein
MERFIRSRSRSLLEIRTIFNQNSVSHPSEVVHQAVPEFLVRSGFALLQPSLNMLHLAGIYHHQLALTSIMYLSQSQMLNCPVTSLLRFAAYKSLTKFLPWVSPKVAENDPENVYETMEVSYAWTRDAPWRAGSLKDDLVNSGVPFATKIGFLELPRLYRLGQVSEELWPAILPPEGISIHIKVDNNGAIGLSAGTTPHPHTKYFDRMEVNYVQEQVQLQRVLLQKIPTEDNIADFFTKPCQSPNLGASVKV